MKQPARLIIQSDKTETVDRDRRAELFDAFMASDRVECSGDDPSAVAAIARTCERLGVAYVLRATPGARYVIEKVEDGAEGSMK